MSEILTIIIRAIFIKAIYKMCTWSEAQLITLVCVSHTQWVWLDRPAEMLCIHSHKGRPGRHILQLQTVHHILYMYYTYCTWGYIRYNNEGKKWSTRSVQWQVYLWFVWINQFQYYRQYRIWYNIIMEFLLGGWQSSIVGSIITCKHISLLPCQKTSHVYMCCHPSLPQP